MQKVVQSILVAGALLLVVPEAVAAGSPEEVFASELDQQVHRRGGRWLSDRTLEAFYAGRQWQPAFVTLDGLTSSGRVLERRLREANAHGIDPDWLGLDRVVKEWGHLLGARDLRDHAMEAAALEVALADSLVRYAWELRYHNRASAPAGTPDITVWQRESLVALLGAAGDDLDLSLNALPPRSPTYEALVEALARYRDLQKKGGWPRVPGELDASASGQAVSVLRARLAAEGYLADSAGAAWDAELETALARFQTAHHIAPAPLVGPETLAALNEPIESRIASIIVSLDRHRDSARGVDADNEAVWVNVAGFYAEVWDGHEELFHTKAVVGRLEGGGQNKTPLFSDTMERIELNPTWYPPARLARTLSPDASRGIVRVNGQLVQLPGPYNALGRVKFLFPNAHAVYLHDTSHRELFAETVRAFSSGCVRVDRPLELAALLIARDQDRDLAETAAWIEEVVATTTTEVVPLTQPLPVHLEYFTAWAAADGIIEFYGDIYRLDRAAVREIARRRDVVWDTGGATGAAE